MGDTNRGRATVGSSNLKTGAVTHDKLTANAVESDNIKAAYVTKAKLAGGFSKVTLADGTAAGTDVNVAGMAVGDELVMVLAFATKAAITTLADRKSEYAVGAGKLVKTAGTDESNNQLVIIWNDLT